MLVVNFISGPGCAKSTTAANVFAKLKWDGINAELITEYAKDKVWEGSLGVIENQIYVFGKQQHKLYRVRNQIDVALVDSPLLFSIIYDKSESDVFRKLVLEEFNKYNNLNVFLRRSCDRNYCEAGRYQTEEESIIIDRRVYNLLVEENIPFYYVTASQKNVGYITGVIKNKLTGI